MLQKKLKKITGHVGLDAGSADFKNRYMFRTDKYYGLDINLDRLKKGLKKYPADNNYAILANMDNLKSLPTGSLDLIVSTNTLLYFSADSQVVLNCVKELCRILAPQGHLLCELSQQKESYQGAIKILKENFDNFKIYYYRNPVSRLYESIFEKDTHLSSHKIAGRKPFRALAMLLGLAESLTCRFKFLNKGSFVVCSHKKDNQRQNKFDLSHLKKIAPKIYQLS